MAELYEELGLTRTEYEQIKELQGREPTHVELAVYSLMWSEHCGYKHSRPHLGRFSSTGTRVLQGPGAVSYTHLRAHETDSYLVCRLLLEKKKKKNNSKTI